MNRQDATTASQIRLGSWRPCRLKRAIPDTSETLNDAAKRVEGDAGPSPRGRGAALAPKARCERRDRAKPRAARSGERSETRARRSRVDQNSVILSDPVGVRPRGPARGAPTTFCKEA